MENGLLFIYLFLLYLALAAGISQRNIKGRKILKGRGTRLRKTISLLYLRRGDANIAQHDIEIIQTITIISQKYIGDNMMKKTFSQSILFMKCYISHQINIKMIQLSICSI